MRSRMPCLGGLNCAWGAGGMGLAIVGSGIATEFWLTGTGLGTSWAGLKTGSAGNFTNSKSLKGGDGAAAGTEAKVEAAGTLGGLVTGSLGLRTLIIRVKFVGTVLTREFSGTVRSF